MSTIAGVNFIGPRASKEGESTFRAVDPTTGGMLPAEFHEATDEEIDRAAGAARAAAAEFAAVSGEQRAGFLDSIGEQILASGEELIERARRETALPEARLVGERGRTVAQLAMFATLLREGSWVNVRIDLAQAGRQPLPKPDLRRMLVAIGPVAVFGASNFPLAFSVAGGDTASALAAGCPVVVKAHPAHPGTCELVARAILEAARQAGMPNGVFSMLQGRSHHVGETLVTHPAIKAVGFTGSHAGGRALFDLGAARPEPIPVYAEMGSSNPVFVLPGALAERAEALADGLAASVTLGGGQFCTNPGLTILPDVAAAGPFLDRAASLLEAAGPCTLVHAGIKAGYDESLAAAASLEDVDVAARSRAQGPLPETSASPALLVTDYAAYTREPRLRDELYGPATLAVRCAGRDEVLQLARSMQGHLTATVHATDEDLETYAELIDILRDKAGRLVFNGYPTGVEVCSAMHHGGPYPATTDSRSTSVGSAAIERFARPVCYQDFPQRVLPAELRDNNPLGIVRLIDGELTRDPVT